MIEENLKKIIAYKTLSLDHGINKQAFEFIKKKVKNLPLFVVTSESNGFPSLIISTKRTRSPRIILQAHMDVVDGPSYLFRPEVKKGKIYGRGAFDMKFAIACYLQLLEDLGKNLPQYDFALMLTSDEEVGGFNGVGALLAKGYKTEICFLPDGGEKDWKLEKSDKGVCQLLVTSKGVSAHSSRTWLGDNAILKLINFLKELNEKFPKEPCGSKNHFHNTINIGTICGGKQTNQIPDHAEATVDIRFTEKTTKKDLVKAINKVKNHFSGIKVEFSYFNNPTIVDIQNKYHKAFQKLIEKTGKKVSFMDSHGSSDARFFVEKNIPVIILRPDGGGHHSNNEWVDIKDLKKFYQVLKEFVQENSKN